MDMIKSGKDADEALKEATGTYGRFDSATKYIDPSKGIMEGYERWHYLKIMNVELIRLTLH